MVESDDKSERMREKSEAYKLFPFSELSGKVKYKNRNIFICIICCFYLYGFFSLLLLVLCAFAFSWVKLSTANTIKWKARSVHSLPVLCTCLCFISTFCLKFAMRIVFRLIWIAALLFGFVFSQFYCFIGMRWRGEIDIYSFSCGAFVTILSM